MTSFFDNDDFEYDDEEYDEIDFFYDIYNQNYLVEKIDSPYFSSDIIHIDNSLIKEMEQKFNRIRGVE